MSPDPVYRVAELRAIEAAAASHPLMERAGLAAAGIARELLAGRPARVLVLAGPGNNGGDAFVVARWLKSWFFDVSVAFRGDAAKLSADALAAHRNWLSSGGALKSEWTDSGDWGLIVDGLFGIGLKRAIEGVYADWITRANASRVPILALDTPSGLDADTGTALAPTVRATATATFIALKPGLLTLDGPDHCGVLSVHALELDAQSSAPAGERLNWGSLKTRLPAPLLRARKNVHKGSFGTLGIVGGNDGMVGAALLAGRAALNLGAGKVWVGLAASNAPAFDPVQPELMLRAAARVIDDGPDAIIVGPGLGTDQRAQGLLRRSIDAAVPLAIDADALTLVARDASLATRIASRRAPTVLTPHPAEAARLAASDTDSIQSDRLGSALMLAGKLNASLVLKGAGSVLAFPDGTWAINTTGNPGLASAGTGDVLAGMLGALLAQGVAAKEALRLAVCVHGAAADALVATGVGPLGLTAGELAPAARQLINEAAA
ncbi:MAG TPA: NAD(P)H-hydrate dehydratase [Casimicrobiaceae bacterium]|nr:NAD(P)H-hydrate dehydratase [Casimicrobiaceae bacterium]